MKSREKKDLFAKEKRELKTLLTQMGSELLSLRLDTKGKKLKNVRALWAKRREIAQVATVLRVKELAEGDLQKGTT